MVPFWGRKGSNSLFTKVTPSQKALLPNLLSCSPQLQINWAQVDIQGSSFKMEGNLSTVFVGVEWENILVVELLKCQMTFVLFFQLVFRHRPSNLFDQPWRFYLSWDVWQDPKLTFMILVKRNSCGAIIPASQPSLILRENTYSWKLFLYFPHISALLSPPYFSLPLFPAIPASCGSAAVQQPRLHAPYLNKNKKSCNSISLTKMPCMESPAIVVSSWRRVCQKIQLWGAKNLFRGSSQGAEKHYH